MFVFFNDTATPEIYTLSLHDALPIFPLRAARTPTYCARGPSPPTSLHEVTATRAAEPSGLCLLADTTLTPPGTQDRKSTRLNSSHANISYAVFCLKKKKLSAEAPRDR